MLRGRDPHCPIPSLAALSVPIYFRSIRYDYSGACQRGMPACPEGKTKVYPADTTCTACPYGSSSSSGGGMHSKRTLVTLRKETYAS